MFDKRDSIIGIMFSGSYHPTESLKNKVEEGDSVELRFSKERILVREIKIISPNIYVGIIYGFEPSFSIQFHELMVGQQIEFSHDQIYCCTANP